MKIYIIGNSGQGKTTVAKRMSKKLNIEYYDMDDLFWRPNWRQIDDVEKVNVLNDINKSENWIISGNYSKISECVKEASECIVWMYYPYRVNMYRSIKRAVYRAWTKTPVCNGNVETWSSFFSKQSIVLWAHQNYKKNEQKGKRWQKEMPEKRWFVIRRKKDITQMINTLESLLKDQSK